MEFNLIMDYTITIVKPLTASIVPVIAGIITSYLLTKWLKDKKDKTWVKLLNSDKYIEECRREYEKIKVFGEKKSPIFSVYGTLLGSFGHLLILFCTLLIFSIFRKIDLFVLVFVSSALIIFLIAFLIGLYINHRIDKIKSAWKKNIKLLDISEKINESEQISNWIILLIFLIFTSSFAVPYGLFKFNPYSNISQIPQYYLFSYDEIPGNDSVKLKEFLNQNYNINWVETSKIEKIGRGKAIRVITENNSLSLRLSDDKTEATLTIDDGRTEKFIVKTENGKLNIYYGVSSIIQILYNTFYDLLFVFWVFAIIILIINLKELPYCQKILLNSKHQLNFPYVRIITNSTELRGKILDIFDENLIILDNYGGATIKAVEWDSITYLELIQFR